MISILRHGSVEVKKVNDKEYNKMKLLVSACAVCLICAGTQAVAQNSDRTFADVYSECGIGAMLFNKSGSESGRTLAIISNVTWDWGTTAHISNNSSEENCEGANASAASFVFHNYDQIETDLAKGGGEHIDALLKNANCAVSNDEVISGLRASISSEEMSQYDKADNLYSTLSSICIG